MIYVLYVFSYLPRPAPTSLRKRAVLGLHLPLHLSIILLLEGMSTTRFVIFSDECAGLQNILTIYVRAELSWPKSEIRLTIQIRPSKKALAG